MERLKRIIPLVAALLFGYALYLQLPQAVRFWRAQRTEAAASYAQVKALTFEQRRVAAYGMCGLMGYGYLRQIVADMPDHALPVVRYPDWDRGGVKLFPWQSRLEPRVMVGIGVSEADFTERQITGMSLEGTQHLGDRDLDRYSFHTSADWDVLTRWDLDLPVLEGDESFEIVLHYSRLDDKVLGRWTLRVARNQSSVKYPLPQPIVGFSHNRGATDFIVEVIRPKRMLPLRHLVAAGIRVSAMPGLQIVHRSPPCFVGVAPEILEAAKQQPTGEWARFLDRVRKLHVD